MGLVEDMKGTWKKVMKAVVQVRRKYQKQPIGDGLQGDQRKKWDKEKELS